MGDDERPRYGERRDFEGQRRRDDLSEHQRNPFAHGELVARLHEDDQDYRKATDKRIGALESFRAQATLVGGIGLLVLGGVVTAIAFKLIH